MKIVFITWLTCRRTGGAPLHDFHAVSCIFSPSGLRLPLRVTAVTAFAPRLQSRGQSLRIPSSSLRFLGWRKRCWRQRMALR